MAENKTQNRRIINKHDIEANWNKATKFIPYNGELIVYDKDEIHNYSRFKFGDGITPVNDLPFSDKGVGKEVADGGEVFNDYDDPQYSEENGLLIAGNAAIGIDSHAEGSLNYVNQNYGHAEGTGNIIDNPESARGSSHAQGWYNRIYGWGAHAEGNRTRVYSNMSHAEGAFTNAFCGTGTHIEGYSNNWADTDIFNPLGYHLLENIPPADKVEEVWRGGWFNRAEWNGEKAIPVYDQDGRETYIEITAKDFASTYGHYSHAEGTNNLAIGNSAHAEGARNLARGAQSHAEGVETEALGQGSHSEGEFTVAIGEGSHSEGNYAKAEGIWSHAEGYGTYARGSCSHTEGEETTAQTIGSHAEGQLTQAIGAQSHAEGKESKAYGSASHAEGVKTVTEGTGSHAEGYETKALAENSHAEGRRSQATYSFAHAEGLDTLASGEASHAEGKGTVAQGQYAHAEGGGSQALGAQSHAEGNSTANTANAHSEGYKTISGGSYGSHAEGNTTQALGNASHAEGKQTYASADSAHAEGISSQATNAAAHAGGSGSVASGHSSFAQGYYVNAKEKHQTVFGRLNKDNADALFIVGNGNSSNWLKSNAFEVLADGSAKLQTQGKDNNSVVQKQYVDNAQTQIQSNVNNMCANAFKDTITGKSIALNDVSPIEHDISVVISNDIDLTFSNFIDISEYSESRLALNDINKIEAGKIYKVFFDGKEYNCVSRLMFGSVVCLGSSHIVDGSGNSEPFGLFYRNFEDDKPFEVGYTLFIYHDRLETVSDSYHIRAVEEDTTVTINGVNYTPNSEGVIEGVKSVSPNMTLVSSGSNIQCTYNRDINKAFEGLKDEILQYITNTFPNGDEVEY